MVVIIGPILLSAKADRSMDMDAIVVMASIAKANAAA